MAQKKSTSDADVQNVLMDVVEVQLAAFRAGIDFWSAWVEQASKFSEDAGSRLGEIRRNPSDANRLLMEIGEASRVSLRAMTDLPRQAAERFIEELGKSEQSRASGKKGAARPKAKRSVRAKP
ncbi:MAG: hypothetical protein OES32_01240 [Acidobacteriota bacterium]|nr:hypothetical protein [Acidobacteriota bacterium]